MQVGNQRVFFLCIFILGLHLSGCSTARFDEKAGYTIAYRQLPPEPPYKRTMQARPPELVKSESATRIAEEKVIPTIHFKMKNASLEQAARKLGEPQQYRSYCAAALAKQKITIDIVGTMEEIGIAIEKQMHIFVSIDHVHKEVRFLGE